MAGSTSRFYGTGRRKSSAARVWVQPGTGKIEINGRSCEDYFPRETTRLRVAQPLIVSKKQGEVDIVANVCGGGQSGQADAICHGLSRALTTMEAELRGDLKRAGLLTRDARIKERKKYGQPGARKQYQFSKR